MQTLAYDGVAYWRSGDAQIQRDFNRNKYFNPQEAVEYGLVDQVIRPPRTQSLRVA